MNTPGINIMATLITISGINATLLHCFGKWGLFEYYEIHRRKSWPPEICIFCLAFWLGVIQYGLLYVFYTSDIFYIAGALASASITKAIYENGKVRIR